LVSLLDTILKTVWSRFLKSPEVTGLRLKKRHSGKRISDNGKEIGEKAGLKAKRFLGLVTTSYLNYV